MYYQAEWSKIIHVINSIIYFLNISLLIGCFPDHLDHLAQFGYDFLITAGGSRYFKSDVQKKQDDTRQSSNGRQSRSPPTYVITELQTSLDLRKIILPGNKPDGPSSCCCKFLVVFSLPVSSAVRWRVLCRKTIGAGTRVRLGFPNARPVVSDELARSSAGQWRKALADRSWRTGLTV